MAARQARKKPPGPGEPFRPAPVERSGERWVRSAGPSRPSLDVLARSRGSGLPAPVAGRSLRAPALRSLDADCAPPGTDPPQADWSWLRLSATPAPGHGQPLAASSRSTGFQPVCLPGSHWARGIIACMCDSGRGSSRIGGTRRSRCDLCNAAVAPKRLSRELTSPAGAEHASGRLRCLDDTTESSVNRISRQWPRWHCRREESTPTETSCSPTRCGGSA